MQGGLSRRLVRLFDSRVVQPGRCGLDADRPELVGQALIEVRRPPAAEPAIDSRSIGPAEDGARGAARRPGLFAPG